ncbi:hypothetical protein BC827DRAFT_1231478 [Russula dissimulans]|nr:hypothetical protein BC827DRAFT_1231478 [Russula dissimulans]
MLMFASCSQTPVHLLSDAARSSPHAYTHTHTHSMVTTFETPKHPSAQLRTVLRYSDVLKVWNIVELGQLFAMTLCSPRAPSRSASPTDEGGNLQFLRGFSQQLDGKHLEITTYDILEAPGRAWANARLHGEFSDGKTFDIESIYKFTFSEHSSPHKIKAVDDFLDSAAFARLGEGGEPSQG